MDIFWNKLSNFYDEDCIICDGSGFISTPIYKKDDPMYNNVSMLMPCPVCGDNGFIKEDDEDKSI